MPDRQGTPERAVFIAACLAGAVGFSGCASKPRIPTNRGLLFRSSGNPQPYINVIDTQSGVAGYNGSGAPELSPGALPGDWGVYNIPTHSGVNVIRFAGSASGGDARCSMKAYSVHIPVDDSTKLSYWIFPQQDNARYVGVDLHCTDGTTLSSTAAVDQNGQSMDPSSGHGDALTPRVWSQVQCEAGKWLSGKTVDLISVLYHHPGGGGQYRGYVDDVVLSDNPIPSRSEIVGKSSPTEPDWVKNAILYGINTRQFSKVGNLAGIVPQLDRLHKLGATVLWLLPINPIGQKKAIGSPYCVQDYYGINPAYGKATDLHRLVDAVHSHGMKIILDETLDHTSWDNDLIEKHPDWYRHDDGNVNNPSTISRTPFWADVAQLDYSNANLRSYMIGMQKYWLTTYNVDGFRYDSAETVPTEFWNASTKELKAVKPNILLLGESHRPETMVSAFDVDYSFTLYPQVVNVLQGHDTPTSIEQCLQLERSQFPNGTLHMRFSGDQDTAKPATAFGSGSQANAAAILMFTLNGVPLIYNGTEIGDNATGNFINAPAIDWAKSNAGTASLYTQLTALRRAHSELVDGDLRWLGNSTSNQVISYARSNNNETILVIENLSSKPVTTLLSLKKDVTVTDLTPTASTTAPAGKTTKAPGAFTLGAYRYSLLLCKAPIAQVVDLGGPHH